MYNFLALLAFGLALVVTPMLARFLANRNVIDRPDGNRKLHERPVPRLGGVAIFSVFAITMLVAIGASKYFASLGRIDVLLRITPALLIIFITGLLDDLFTLPARNKLFFQLCAAVTAVAMGIRFDSNAGDSLAGLLVSSALTIVWLVLCTNAFNLIDGVDGLAAGLGLILAATVTLAGAHSHNSEVVLIGLVSAGCLLGFLRYNFSPASIFLGDSGSLTIGFLLSCLGVLWSNQQTTVIGKAAPVIAFAVPLADVFLSICRRFLGGRPIFSPDRDHIHHRLLRNGLPARSVTLVLYAAAGLASVTAIVCSLFAPATALCALAAFSCAAVLACRQLNYVEFRALSAAARNLSLTPLLKSYLTLNNFNQAIAAGGDRLAFWNALKLACSEFGFDDIRLTWAGHTYEDSLAISDRPSRMSFYFSIDDEDSLVMSGNFSARHHGPALDAFIQIVLNELRSRSASPVHAARRVKDLSAAKAPSVAIR